MRKMIYGIGVNDLESKTWDSGSMCNVYSTWHQMLRRCYSESFLIKNKTYYGCSVCKDWHRLSVFKKWFDENYISGWELDKDLMFPGNKEYSPENCVFVPRAINSLFLERGAKRGDCVIGVSYNKDRNKYVAGLSVRGKRVSIGRYDTELEAHNAYLEAKRKYILEVINDHKAMYPDKQKFINLLNILEGRYTE